MNFIRCALACLLGLVALNSARAQGLDKLEPGVMHTLAGTGKKGFTGDGGQAKEATLAQPFHVDVDGKGNLYIAEAENHCIRKMSLKTGVLSTVAGCGKKGYTGDGGKATEATFNEPYAVVVDKDDNLYIADRLNAVIRKVDGKTGVITTIAGTGKKGSSGDGGPGAEATLVEPNDVFLLGGILLIADVADWRIRQLDLKTGIIRNFAGAGRPAKAGKGMPRDKIGDGLDIKIAVVVGARAVCADPKGVVYICEREGSSIRKINPVDRIMRTFSGDGTWGEAGDDGPPSKAVYRGPKGVRCDKAGNVYVVDCENHSIRKIDVEKKLVTTVAGGRKGSGGDRGPATKAGMDRPHGCVIDDNGILYIADTNNHRVRIVKLGGD